MGIIELHRKRFVEVGQAISSPQVNTDHVLQGAGNEEILLFQTQLLSLKGFIVRIKTFRDVLGHHLVVNRTIVVTHIDLLKTEGFAGFRFPQTQRISGIHVIAKNSHIAGNTVNHLRRNPAHPVAALFVGVSFGMTTEIYLDSCLWTRNLPRISKSQASVRDLHLPAILNLLAKDAEFVADTVADSGNL